MNGILYYFEQMLPYILLAVPFAVLFRVLRIVSMRRKNLHTNALHEIGIIVFILFSVGLASQTIIPYIEISNGFYIDAGFGLSEISLQPMRIFRLMMDYENADARLNFFLINIIGNIAMFIPIGFFSPLLWKRISFPKAILIGFLSSLFIELCQVFEPRVCDIDDLWMNTLGAVLGALIYLLLNKLLPKLTARFKISVD